ncbi:unnamed protein product [Closterium sp. NIES-64]|nr:unnamed protein product [Closterium sp. NIES-64]
MADRQLRFSSANLNERGGSQADIPAAAQQHAGGFKGCTRGDECTVLALTRHVAALISLLRRSSMLEELRAAREAMNALFPLSPAMWQQWAHDETRLIASDADVAKVEALYKRGVEEYVVSLSPPFHLRSLLFPPPPSLPPHPRLCPSSHFLSSHFLSSHFLSSHFLSSHFLSPHFLSPHFLSPHFLSPHFLSPHFLSSHFLSSHFLSSHFLSSHFLSSHFLSSHFLSSHFISSHFLSSHFLSSHFLSSHFLSSHFLSSHFLSSHFLSSHFLSSHFLSSHFLSSHFLSPHFLCLPPPSLTQSLPRRSSHRPPSNSVPQFSPQSPPLWQAYLAFLAPHHPAITTHTPTACSSLSLLSTPLHPSPPFSAPSHLPSGRDTWLS